MTDEVIALVERVRDVAKFSSNPTIAFDADKLARIVECLYEKECRFKADPCQPHDETKCRPCRARAIAEGDA